jgi:hypothetical protein
MKEIKLNVPYYSQYLEVKDYQWNISSCTGACVAMVLEFLAGKKIDILQFMKKAGEEGGCTRLNGTSHDYVIKFFESEGLKSWRYKNKDTKDVLDTVDPIVESIRGGSPVIVSISKFVLEQKKFHTVLVIGLKENEQGEVTHFYYHEPEATIASVPGDPAVGGEGRCCDLETFKKSWRGRAIFVSK